MFFKVAFLIMTHQKALPGLRGHAQKLLYPIIVMLNFQHAAGGIIPGAFHRPGG